MLFSSVCIANREKTFPFFESLNHCLRKARSVIRVDRHAIDEKIKIVCNFSIDGNLVRKVDQFFIEAHFGKPFAHQLLKLLFERSLFIMGERAENQDPALNRQPKDGI